MNKRLILTSLTSLFFLFSCKDDDKKDKKFQFTRVDNARLYTLDRSRVAHPGDKAEPIIVKPGDEVFLTADIVSSSEITEIKIDAHYADGHTHGMAPKGVLPLSSKVGGDVPLQILHGHHEYLQKDGYFSYKEDIRPEKKSKNYKLEKTIKIALNQEFKDVPMKELKYHFHLIVLTKSGLDNKGTVLNLKVEK